mmetsp:Transcript_17022/g.26291  ORF Transcript_17022/g.26291 Transcript_17022/m.26291 type:complete len:80 (-) Transcript_17022:3047-3286(-)
MGAQFSQDEYRSKLHAFNNDYLTLEHSPDLDQFLKLSDDFANVFTSVTLDDFRTVKDTKVDNLVHMISHAVKVMHDCAT